MHKIASVGSESDMLLSPSARLHRLWNCQKCAWILPQLPIIIIILYYWYDCLNIFISERDIWTLPRVLVLLSFFLYPPSTSLPCLKYRPLLDTSHSHCRFWRFAVRGSFFSYLFVIDAQSAEVSDYSYSFIVSLFAIPTFVSFQPCPVTRHVPDIYADLTCVLEGPCSSLS